MWAVRPSWSNQQINKQKNKVDKHIYNCWIKNVRRPSSGSPKLRSECYLNAILDLNLDSDYGDDDGLLLYSCFYTHIYI